MSSRCSAIVCFLSFLSSATAAATTADPHPISGTMSQKSNSVEIGDLRDIRTPFGVPLSGIYKRSFAYLTIKDRLPVILTKVIDTLSRNKETIANTYGPKSSEEIKKIIHSMSELKNEIITNKPLRMLLPPNNAPNDDTNVWNEYLKKRSEIEGGTPRWFNTLWLYCECYMYRRIVETFLLTETLKTYDPFLEQKQTGFVHSIGSINALANYLMNVISNKGMSDSEKKEELTKLMKINLWGNRCDLSLSAGKESNQEDNPIEVLHSLDKDILVNDSNHVWDILKARDTVDTVDTVDMVLDNAGYELFTDICLAAFLIAQGLAQKVRFYVKRYPWYVSDTTLRDFRWTVDYMKNSPDSQLRAVGELASAHLDNGVWTIEEEDFWTKPYNIADMKSQDPTLYAKLSHAKLVVFKGDLNYRKLLSDINWEYTTCFRRALMDFQPTNVLSLRTVKSDVCVGLPAGKAEELFEIDEKWMFTGQYGLIQLNAQVNC